MAWCDLMILNNHQLASHLLNYLGLQVLLIEWDFATSWCQDPLVPMPPCKRGAESCSQMLVNVYNIISFLEFVPGLQVSPILFQMKEHFIWIIFSCDQAALQMVFSVCPSVRLSVCPSVRLSVTPFWLCSHHRIIMKFSGVITNDGRKVHAKGQGQRSKVKVTEVTTHLNRFRTVTPVWIHIWWRNDAYSLMLVRRGALLFFKVIHKISRSHGCKNRRIWPRLGVSGL